MPILSPKLDIPLSSPHLPAPILFRSAYVPAQGLYPQHQHAWGEFVYSFSGVMEVKVTEHHFLAPRAGSYLPGSDDPALGAVLRLLQAQPGDNRALPELARAAHTTERTLMCWAQRDLGMSLAEWRQRLRVVKAMPLLEAGQTVETIALDLGYGSASAFITMFRRLMGSTPDEFRKNAAGRHPKRLLFS